jgi:ABC-type transporter Mla subunit MlaD
MTAGDDLDRIKQTLDYVAMLQRSHDEQIGKLVEQSDRREKELDTLRDTVGAMSRHMNVLTGRTIQAMEAIARLARIPDIHENRLDALEDAPQ